MSRIKSKIYLALIIIISIMIIIPKIEFATEVNTESISLDKTNIVLNAGENINLKATVVSTNKTNKTITWSSSNNNIARADVTAKGGYTGNATVFGLNMGTATITATIDGESTKCKVTVQPSIKYEVHLQTDGWVPAVRNGEQAGTTGQSRRLEAIKIKIEGDKNINVLYRAHIQGQGWEEDFVKDGAISGTTGLSKRMEAIQIKLGGADASKYNVYYRTHVESYDWLGWAKNGESAGTTGLSKRIEAIQIKIVKKGIEVNLGSESAFITSNVKTFKTLNTSNCSVFANVPNINSCTSTQSLCVTDKYYVVQKMKDDNLTTLCVYDKNSGKRINTALKGDFHHANGATYNPDDKCMYIVHFKDKKVSKIKASTLISNKLSRDIIKEPVELTGIAYDNYTKNWILKSGQIVRIYNKDLTKEINHFKVAKHTGQDCGVYKGLLLSIDYVSWNHSDIYIYDELTSKCYGKYSVKIPGELESIDYDSANNRFVMVFNDNEVDKIYTTKAINIDSLVK